MFLWDWSQETVGRQGDEVKSILQASTVGLELVQFRERDDVTSGGEKFGYDVEGLLNWSGLVVKLWLDSL
jgi:hypothetical protein